MTGRHTQVLGRIRVVDLNTARPEPDSPTRLHGLTHHDRQAEQQLLDVIWVDLHQVER